MQIQEQNGRTKQVRRQPNLVFPFSSLPPPWQQEKNPEKNRSSPSTSDPSSLLKGVTEQAPPAASGSHQRSTTVRKNEAVEIRTQLACVDLKLQNGITPVAHTASPGHILKLLLILCTGEPRPPLPLPPSAAAPPERKERGAGHAWKTLKEKKEEEREDPSISLKLH